MIYTRNMRQAAIYYPPTGQDAFGQPSFGAGQDVLVRWQDKADLFRDAQGREVVSSAVVYVSEECEIGGKIGLGDASLSDAREIRNIARSPSLDGARTLVKLWL